MPVSNTPSSESHWSSSNPEDQPAGQKVMSLPRMVLDARARRGGGATPEQVVRELEACGIRTSIAEVEAVWDEGHVPPR